MTQFCTEPVRAVHSRPQWLGFLLALLTVLTVVWIYWNVDSFEFISLDDGFYVGSNYRIQGGISFDSVRWAFTALYSANWHPITWLSHLIDIELFGLNPGGHHLVNVVLHAANSVLLLLVLRLATGLLWPSTIVAFLFAVHPLHVESVAWVSERKDVLSTCFMLATILSYMAFVRDGKRRYYLLAVAGMILGLMAKPMLVSLPLLLLLFDIWPLRRIGLSHADPQIPPTPRRHARLLIEKLPFVLASAGSCVVTVIAQHSCGAMNLNTVVPLSTRIQNAVVAYAHYLWKTVYPVNLACYYPYQTKFPFWQVAGSGLLLFSLTVLAVRTARRNPEILIGWLWFLVSLVPVIGIVQVGAQSMADRYMYIPSIGLFTAVVFPMWHVRGQIRHALRWAVTGTTITGIVSLTLQARAQASYWHDDYSLATRALEVTRKNHVAHSMRGNHLVRAQRLEEAREEFEAALAINRKSESAVTNLCLICLLHGDTSEGVRCFERLLEKNPSNSVALLHVGRAYVMLDSLSIARNYFERILSSDPNFVPALDFAAAVTMRQGDTTAARGYLTRLRVFRPGTPDIKDMTPFRKEEP